MHSEAREQSILEKWMGKSSLGCPPRPPQHDSGSGQHVGQSYVLSEFGRVRVGSGGQLGTKEIKVDLVHDRRKDL